MSARRAAIYARFSTELQRDRSIEDQVALCRQHAHAQGLSVVATYEDRARSGASIFGRDGLERMLAAADARAFDCIVVEALDRLSRDMADLAGIHRRLNFLGIELRAVHDGVADTVTVGLRGLVGQLFREDGAKKVRRGMAGVIRDGRHAGGRAYGYRPTPGAPGRLAIVEDEAAVVRRIFADYVGGKSPREIAGDLNREGVAPPRGAAWNASTINGSVGRHNGIIQNPLYAGEIVWNRVRMLKDPSTGRRISRPNPESEWQRQPAPELAIVAPDVAAAALARKRSNPWAAAPRGPRAGARSYLSGLLRCGACGAGMSKHDVSGGRPRIRCSAARESGTCPDARPVYLDRIEEGVLELLRAELGHPELIAEYVQAYHDERQRLAGRNAKARISAEKKLADLAAREARMVEAIASGADAFGALRSAFEQIEAERRQAQTALEEANAGRKVVTLHPRAVASFRRTLDDLAGALKAGETTALAHASFRGLVDRVVVHQQGKGEQPRVEIVGRLAALLDIKGLGSPPRRAALGGKVVAEVRYLEIPHDPTTAFRVVWAA